VFVLQVGLIGIFGFLTGELLSTPISRSEPFVLLSMVAAPECAGQRREA